MTQRYEEHGDAVQPDGTVPEFGSITDRHTLTGQDASGLNATITNVATAHAQSAIGTGSPWTTTSSVNIGSVIQDVFTFMDTCKQHMATEPAWPDEKTMILRASLGMEETEELHEAVVAGDLVATVDALIDRIYVDAGWLLVLLGRERAQAAWNAVQESNMSKFPDGKAIFDEGGKVMKPDSYFKADLDKIVGHGWVRPDWKGENILAEAQATVQGRRAKDSGR